MSYSRVLRAECSRSDAPLATSRQSGTRWSKPKMSSPRSAESWQRKYRYARPGTIGARGDGSYSHSGGISGAGKARRVRESPVALALPSLHVSREQLRLARLVGLFVAVALVAYVVIGLSLSGSGILQPEIRASGEPDTGEVTIRVLNIYLNDHVADSTCKPASAGHWTCSLRLADGRKGSARVVWHGRTQKLGVALDRTGFR